ncbi:peptidoglycan DD-metalloendopeptidase family protein [Lachnospiraceae bacterium WCA-9-b2]|jgi:septal ring factor EnvC (AmiA/AmiB activator)|uniref:Peptidoglycan DD-metalloendopeptidase family protein n=1 Tax=Sporofaciens musculi TaxID=2681861 RepID=A0A7X3SH81_9FIRM|nr:M23 family metallopeptidase [Sporofaciens musculi]MXP74109.1 peptidoglycan DD-metalloendopeptidase family protein [Sporofaciens musculi]
MNKRQRPSQKKRSAAVAAVVCFVAAIALVGTYTFNDYKRTQQKEKLALAEEDDTKDEKKKEPAEEANNLVINNKVDDEPEEKPEEPTPEDTTEQTDSTDVQQTEGSSRAITFNENSQLLWPVNGTIIMSYSMDKTVYFQTLDQYKYNPAVVISGAEGDQVICGTTGIVKSIDVTAETGTTVNVDIGNGYELFYGQLKEVPVKVGDYVEAKSVIGYVSQPTKYYSVEGSNVYFEMRKDGQPINPVEYLEE